MAGTFRPGDPSGLIVRQWVAAGTGGATGVRRHPLVTVSIPIPQINSGASSGTANAQFVSWINPEVGTILVTDAIVTFTTTGTGTFVMGVSADGTGSASDMVVLGSMNQPTALGRRVAYGTAAFQTTAAGTGGFNTVFVLGPGGTGVGNSIVAKVDEVTSTAVGRLVIMYVPLT